ncbi:MAG: alpha-glucan family phosphorylase [Anaerolineae bacterium]|nr:alpha-glucan family phosphorylase [Anaerolineae bacterium]
MIRPNAKVDVIPALPPALERLRELAYNMYWAWDQDAIELFRRMDRDLWENTSHNPVWMLGLINQRQLQELADDKAFMALLDRVYGQFRGYMDNTADTWYGRTYQDYAAPYIAYFSPEFGLTECLRSYSGGLGVLAGDHVKSASDLGVPLVGVGILYQEGYFHQYLNADGWQQESYPINDFPNLPVTLVRDGEGKPATIRVSLPGRELCAQLWRVQAGRVPVILMDTNLPQNQPYDRDISDRLYGGDRDMRLRQEILLGIGGIRALEVLEMRPVVCHMNEGHSAFLGLERIRVLMKENGLSFREAKEVARAGTVFTVHTPVPAGIERFSFEAMDAYFGGYYNELGLSRDEFLNLGRENVPGQGEMFALSVLAINLSRHANGVAQLHGVVSRRIWQWMFPQLPQHEVPIDAITNGIHVASWISRDMATLFDRYLDPNWRDEPNNSAVWRDAERIPDGELWRTHERRRERLVGLARQRLRAQLEARGAPTSELLNADEVLNPDALTIGFARRFATYKRATLLLRDPDRLKRLLSDPDRPVQFIFAGKAHPQDGAGKDLIRTIVHFASQPEYRHAIVFLENYDMVIARYMVQGCDVWLNTPRRPREASGTSGMKVVYNGGLNASIPDGWWAEAYDPDVGWSIGAGEEYQDANEQDHIESRALYNLLENDIIPMFYNRGRDGLPREWIAKMKNALTMLAPYFNTHRMLHEYTNQFYIPSRDHYRTLTQPDFSRGKALAAWLERVRGAWPNVRVVRVDTPDDMQITVGDEIEIKATVELGALTPDDVDVELYHGPLDTNGDIASGDAIQMQYTGKSEETRYVFATPLKYDTSGARGMAVRVMPDHPDLADPRLTGLVHWAP